MRITGLRPARAARVEGKPGSLDRNCACGVAQDRGFQPKRYQAQLKPLVARVDNVAKDRAMVAEVGNAGLPNGDSMDAGYGAG